MRSLRRRHWKQRWDPEAPLIFAKRLRIGDNPKKPFALPGDKVTKKHRESLGPNRLRAWFENGTLQLADFTPPEPQRRLALQQRKQREQFEAKKLAELKKTAIRSVFEVNVVTLERVNAGASA